MTSTKKEARPEIIGAGFPSSQQVTWFECHLFLAAVLDQANVGPLPVAGTPAWLELADGDPRKLLALAEAGVHRALAVDCEQAVRAEASSEIATADDWSAVARRVVQGRGPAYIPRKAAS